MAANANKRLQYLQALDVQVWTMRKSAKTTDANLKPTSELDWEELQARVVSCTACPLYKTRTNSVFGVGNQHADLLIIGEAPGANEDKQGEPFVGRGGRLLNSILQSIGLSREQVYIANILKSRPPNNRDPLPEEVAACTPYLQRQIALLQPKLILAVGRIAAHFLLGTDEAMSRLRGREFHYGDSHIPLFITYHPAYLLRAPREKRKAWQDMLLVQKHLAQLK